MIKVDKNICPHDHICPLVRVCPVKAITQGRDGYPIIDSQICRKCGKCIRFCPMKAISFIQE